MMDDVDVNVRNAAEELFLRNGPTHTNMTQVARAAGVSRQTVYAYFESKDVLIASVTRQIMDRILSQLQVGWRDCVALSEKLEVFFCISVREPFAILQKHPDLKLLLQGGSERTAEVIRRGEQQISEALALQLAPYENALSGAGTTATDLANYITRVSKELKYGALSRHELDQHLFILAKSTIALACNE